MKLLLMTCLLCVSPLFVSAMVVSIDSAGPVPVGSTKLISVSLDTEGQQINTIEGKVSIPEEFLKIESVRDAGSVISFWTESPTIEEGVIHFSGIIPGGFSGQGIVAQIAVSGVRVGIASLRIPEFEVFLHDGEGTSQETRIQNKTVEIVASDGKEPFDERELDTTPPETFSVTVVEEDEVFEGKRVLIFATHDEQSGMSYYEVQETNERTPHEALWVRAESPFVLSEVATKYVFVRAYDNAGNNTVVRYDADSGTPLDRALYVLIFFTLVLLLVVVLIRRKHHQYARTVRSKNSEGK